LEVNGKKKKEENAKLKTANFQFTNALFAPVGILNKSLQAHYDYMVLKKENFIGDECVIIEAVPKSYFKADLLYGRVWVRESDFAILKIEWSPERIGNYHIFKQRAEDYKAQLRITIISEFAVEKKGFRFPNSLYIEEAYV
jgi:hypothetical protein